jgi:hypothetical protein
VGVRQGYRTDESLGLAAAHMRTSLISAGYELTRVEALDYWLISTECLGATS